MKHDNVDREFRLEVGFILVPREKPVETVILDTRVEIAMNKCTVWTTNIGMGHG